MSVRTVVHRLEIAIDDRTDVDLDGFRRAIHVAPHRHNPNTHLEIWYERYTPATTSDRVRVRFHVHGTGHEFDHSTTAHGNLGVNHLGTVATHAGDLIWHVYAEYPIEVDRA